MKIEELEEAFFKRLQTVEAVCKQEIDRLYLEAEKEIDVLVGEVQITDH